MVINTKRKLIDVARRLFAEQGVEGTTMNDIAEASFKGRRTLYTYFSSKKDVYKAVIETELNMLYDKLEEVTTRDLSADEKLILLVFTRLEAIKEVVNRNGTLRADFFGDIREVEKVRKEFDKREIGYLEVILEDGVNSGIFNLKNREDIRAVAQIIHYAFKGLEAPVILGKIELQYSSSEDRRIISNILFNGLRSK